jgi:hypothetical protein
MMKRQIYFLLLAVALGISGKAIWNPSSPISDKPQSDNIKQKMMSTLYTDLAESGILLHFSVKWTVS